MTARLRRQAMIAHVINGHGDNQPVHPDTPASMLSFRHLSEKAKGRGTSLAGAGIMFYAVTRNDVDNIL
jgi:hypothetical protein